MTTLVMATEGPCAGHFCDNCAICRKGRCCRRDNPDYRLPTIGEWDGPIYGEIGVLAEDGDKVECHCCGERFVSLPSHIVWKHDLNSDEYRAIFGLNRHRALLGKAARERRSQWAASRTEFNAAMLEKAREILETVTPEQKSEWHDRPFRPEGRAAISAGRGGQKFYECVICGKMTQHLWAPKMKTCGPECAATLRSQLAKAHGLGKTHRPPQARIGMDGAREIRRRHDAGESKRALAREFGVNKSTISQLIQGITWKEEDIGKMPIVSEEAA